MEIETTSGIYAVTLKPFYGIGIGFFKQTLRGKKVNSFILLFIKISFIKKI